MRTREVASAVAYCARARLPALPLLLLLLLRWLLRIYMSYESKRGLQSGHMCATTVPTAVALAYIFHEVERAL